MTLLFTYTEQLIFVFNTVEMYAMQYYLQKYEFQIQFSIHKVSQSVNADLGSDSSLIYIDFTDRSRSQIISPTLTSFVRQKSLIRTFLLKIIMAVHDGVPKSYGILWENLGKYCSLKCASLHFPSMD